MMTLESIRNVEFNRGRGYRAEEVDDFIDACVDTVQQLMQEKEELTQKMKILADKLVEYRNDEDTIRSALLNAQRTGDNVLREAAVKAQQIIDEAKCEAEKAHREVLTQIEDARRELKQVQDEVAAFKARMLTMYKEHLELIRLIPEQAETVEEKPVEEKPIEEQPVEAQPVEETVVVPVAPPESVTAEIPIPVVEEASADDNVIVAPPVEEVVAIPEQEQDMKPVSRFSNLKFGNDYDISADDDDEPKSRRKKRK